MRQALSADALATDLAEYLVRKGVPFRETHHISGRAVALAESRTCQISELSVDDFKKLDARFGDDVMAVFNFETSVEHRASIGGTSLAMVQRQVDILRAALKN
jgi:argininosuccinate lyase